MFFVIPTGRRYTATMRGDVTKSVRCEACGLTYNYSMKVTVAASGTSPLFLDNKGAKSRAVQDAQERFQSAAKESVAAVPCPKCGWYRANTTKVWRQALYKFWDRRFVWWIICYFSLLVVASFCASGLAKICDSGTCKAVSGSQR